MGSGANGVRMKLQSIQLLRAVAVVLVVLFHIRAQEWLLISQSDAEKTPLMGGFALNGYAGVDLFFVISGFIMVHVTRDLPTGLATAKEFLFARLTRIYPIWWVFAAIAVGLSFAQISFSGSAGMEQISGTEPPLAYLLKSFFLLPQTMLPLPGVGWTLIHEVYFYLVFTLIILTPRNWWIALLFGWGCLVAFGGMLGLSAAHASNLPELIFFPMTMEFVIGAAVGIAVQSGFARHAGIVMLAAVLWFVFALAAHGEPTFAALSWGRVVWFGLPSALLVYAIVTLELHERLVWLVPATIGFVVGLAFFQLYGFKGGESAGLRYGAGALSATVSLIAMLVTLWGGYLFAQSSPDGFMAQGPRLGKLMNKAASVGDMSYSLYLSHAITLVILREIFARFSGSILGLDQKGWIANLIFIFVALIASFLVAKLSYIFIEKPLMRLFRNMRRRTFENSEPETTEKSPA